MKISGSFFDPIRPDRANHPNGTTPRDPAAPPVDPASPVGPRADSVELSAEARSRAEQAAQLDPERVAEIRRKVYEGAYNSLDVVDQVARRILHRGDI